MLHQVGTSRHQIILLAEHKPLQESVQPLGSRLEDQGCNPGTGKIISFSTTYSPSLCSKQAYTQMLAASVLQVENPRVDVFIRIHLEPTLEMCRALGYFRFPLIKYLSRNFYSVTSQVSVRGDAPNLMTDVRMF